MGTPIVDFKPPEVSVSRVAFEDEDDDTGQIAGQMTWSAPPDRSSVTVHDVFLSESASGANKVLFGSTTAGTDSFAVPPNRAPNHALRGFTHLLVITCMRNDAGQQVELASVAIVDAEPPTLSVTHVAFTDTDADHDEIGGVLSWAGPAAASHALPGTTVAR